MGIAPTTFFAIAPSLKRIIVGIERTSYSAAVCWFSSTLMLTIAQVVALAVDLLEDRVDDAAGAAPGGPEVDEHRPVGVEHVGFEGCVGYVGEFASHWYRSRI